MPPQWLTIGTSVLGVLFSLVTAAISYGASRQKIADLTKRVAELEADMAKVGDVRTAVAVLTEQVKGFRELVERDTRELRHDISGMKLSMDKIMDFVRPAAAR